VKNYLNVHILFNDIANRMAKKVGGEKEECKEVKREKGNSLV